MILLKRSILMMLNRFENCSQEHQENILEKEYLDMSDHKKLGHLHKNLKNIFI